MSQQFTPPAPTQQMQAVIRDVNQRTITKRDGSQMKLFDVSVDGFNEALTTGNQRTANEAYDLKGQLATIDYVTKVNGVYTNYYINAVVAAVQNGQPPSPQAQQFAQSIAQQPAPVTSHGIPDTTSARDEMIWRQTASKVAATLVGVGGNPVDFWSNVDMLVNYYETGQKPIFSNPDEDDGIPF